MKFDALNRLLGMREGKNVIERVNKYTNKCGLGICNIALSATEYLYKFSYRRETGIIIGINVIIKENYKPYNVA